MFLQSEVYAKPGELMQGVLPGNQAFLLSNKSSAFFKSITTLRIASTRSVLALHQKSAAAVELFWEGLSAQLKKTDVSRLEITQQSNIPVGKGLSSSSADVLGVLSVLNQFYKVNYSVEKLYALAAAIEPTDPCLHSEHILLNQRQGEVLKTFCSLPFQLVYFDSDPRTVVDTVEFSKTLQYRSNHQQAFQTLYRSIHSALEQQDYAFFYECIRSSAEINNTYLPKKKFQLLMDFAIVHRIGLFIAHSGTYMGLVIAPDRYAALKEKTLAFIHKHWEARVYAE
jgi:L-threonine kinase